MPLAIATLIESRCRELGLSKLQLVRSAGYENESKGLRRLQALIAGNLVSTRGLITALPAALGLPPDDISRAVDQTREQVGADRPCEAAQTTVDTPVIIKLPAQQAEQQTPISGNAWHHRLVARSHVARAATLAILARTTHRIEVRRRLCRRSLRKYGRQAYVFLHMSLFRGQYVVLRVGKPVLAAVDQWSASIVAMLAIAVFLGVYRDTPELKTSEMFLTCAVVIGGALALILSLSIIPAQRAAEAFSAAILQLYAQDRWLAVAFLTLVTTATASALLGTNFMPRVDARISICIQFLLLGISFDALRMFYKRALALLIPRTAIELVVRQCTKLVDRVRRTVAQLSRIQAIATGTGSPTTASRAVFFSALQVSNPLRFWIGQLDEIAHKLIVRRDTSAVSEIVSAMGSVGRRYSEARRDSLILVPDFSNLLAGGVSDVSKVLDPLYDYICDINEDAAKSSNEAVVKHCVQTLTMMTTHAMTMVHSSDRAQQTAPLAFSPCYRLGICATIAVKFDMSDATLAAVEGLKAVLLARRKNLDTSTIESQSLESLSTLLTASYMKGDRVWGFPAMRAMLLAARHDIELNGYGDTPTLRGVLNYARLFTPLEVAMEKAGKRVMQVFPPYDLSFNCTPPALLELVSRQIKVDAERQWANPFDEFLQAAEDIRHFYLQLSDTDFENTLLRKWVIESLMAAARVHWALVVQPLEGTEGHVDDVDESLRWLISWVPSFFPARDQSYGFQAKEAANSLTCLGISLFEHDRTESARACASAIESLATKSAAVRPEPYELADLHERLEILARAAEALDRIQEATTIRDMIQKPATVAEADWPHFLEARQTRYRQLDRNLRERRRAYGVSDDPIWELQRILKAAASRKLPDPSGTPETRQLD